MQKAFIILAASILLLSTISLLHPKTETPSNLSVEIISAFKVWKTTHNRHYTREEEFYRMQVFADNLEKITSLNEENSGASFAMNAFGDMTAEEFVNTFLGELGSDTSEEEVNFGFNVVGDVDWRSKGVV